MLFQSPEERGFLIQVLESTYRFTMGSVAGGKFSVWLSHYERCTSQKLKLVLHYLVLGYGYFCMTSSIVFSPKRRRHFLHIWVSSLCIFKDLKIARSHYISMSGSFVSPAILSQFRMIIKTRHFFSFQLSERRQFTRLISSKRGCRTKGRGLSLVKWCTATVGTVSRKSSVTKDLSDSIGVFYRSWWGWHLKKPSNSL